MLGQIGLERLIRNMAYIFNPFLGQLDDINYSSSINSSGDLQIGNVIANAVSFIEARAIKLYQGGAPIPPKPVTITGGQPIPIGLGLTFTYAGNIN